MDLRSSASRNWGSQLHCLARTPGKGFLCCIIMPFPLFHSQLWLCWNPEHVLSHFKLASSSEQAFPPTLLSNLDCLLQYIEYHSARLIRNHYV